MNGLSVGNRIWPGEPRLPFLVTRTVILLVRPEMRCLGHYRLRIYMAGWVDAHHAKH